jgi:hypothetical protein
MFVVDDKRGGVAIVAIIGKTGMMVDILPERHHSSLLINNP